MIDPSEPGGRHGLGGERWLIVLEIACR